MEQMLSPYVSIEHIEILEHLGNNKYYDKIYREILKEFQFLMKIHVDSLKRTEELIKSEHTELGLLPIGMIKSVAIRIDELMPEANLPFKTCIWYEISRQLVQQSIFRFHLVRFD